MTPFKFEVATVWPPVVHRPDFQVTLEFAERLLHVQQSLVMTQDLLELPLPGDARFFATNLPASLSIDSLTGRITGTVMTAGTVPIALVLTASNTAAALQLHVTVKSTFRLLRPRYYPGGLFGFEIDVEPGE